MNLAPSVREHVCSSHLSSELGRSFLMTVNVMYCFIMFQSLFEIVKETVFSFPFDIKLQYR